MLAPGTSLLEVCKSASRSVFIASPFVKLDALRKVIAVLGPDVTLTIVVRFLPADIAAGVTDAEIVQELIFRPRTRVLAHPRLHAKIYRADESVLVGSANLTHRGMGWCAGSNIEVLIDGKTSMNIIQATEAALLQSSYELTPARVASVLANLPKEFNPRESDMPETDDWIPSCSRPSALWDVYDSGDANILAATLDAAHRDLLKLDVPKGLTRDLFDQYVRSSFLTSEVYKAVVDRVSSEALSDADGPTWLAENFKAQNTESPEDSWRALKEWLRLYGVGVVHIAAVTEKIVKAQRIR